MRILVAALGATVVLGACSNGQLIDGGGAVTGKSAALASKTYRGGLDFPIDMAWVSGTNKIFFTQKGGELRILKGKKLVDQPCATFNVNESGERGLLGIALDSRFDRNHRLYVYYTNASPLENRVARVVVKHDRCTHKKDVVKGLSASSSGYHNGGQLEVVGHHLFVSVGEAHDAGNAQDKGSRLGKVLRYNTDGSIPPGNPFSRKGARNPVWSYGHRNPFGLAWRPGKKMLYETENGPSCDDEVNVIAKGRNYGWGDGYGCGTNGVGDNPKSPMRRWTPTIVPTDATWYQGRIKKWSGSLLMGDFGNGRLHRFVLNSKGTAIKKESVIAHNDAGIVDVAKGPGGWLYYLTPSAIVRIRS